MKIVSLLLSLYIITKPFYLWSSGLPQISDIILLFAFIITLLTTNKKAIMQVITENRLLFFFVLFAMIINTLYTIYYSEFDFLLHGLYYIFDLLGVITFVISMKYINGFKNTMSRSFKISLILQLLIYLIGLGRTYGSLRYMGTFNDPNQFAYYCFLAFGFIFLLDEKKKRKKDFVFLILSVFLIYESASTGMLVGMVVFLIMYVFVVVKKAKANPRRYIVSILASIFVIFSGLMVFAVLNKNYSFFTLDGNPVLSRFEQKIMRVDGEEGVNLWQERGYDRILFYPYYCLFGAGEGGYWRFDKAFHQYEMHATLPSILFCYGFVPTIFVVLWLYKRLKKQKLWVLAVYSALLIESFTLINSRQVLFWVIFAISPYFSSKTLGEDTNEKT